ncbi:MAG TPA: GntR family transcriptional regulator [Acidobacteriaceae bacterium]|jgi:GntR family transcriptional regulator|nr:GntR family transcriptional regulator [Acidobacteriaceae bacterium]
MKAPGPDKTAEFRFRHDAHSGVPLYRQLIDQVLAAVARGTLRTGDQLPTVRQVAVDLAINPNTVMRAYREMEIREILDTQQGSGTFVAEPKVIGSSEERGRQLEQLIREFVARGGSLGFTAQELIRRLRDTVEETGSRRK